MDNDTDRLMEIYIPPALVLGCNTPHGIGVLSDWIEEQTGHPFDFTSTGWSQINNEYNYDASGNGVGNGSVCGYGNSVIRGMDSLTRGYVDVSDGRGEGHFCGICGNGYGYATGYGNKNGNNSDYYQIRQSA